VLELEAGVLLLDVVSGGVMVFGSFLCGAFIDRACEAKVHFMLAVEQLTHTGRFSSHCKFISEILATNIA